MGIAGHLAQQDMLTGGECSPKLAKTSSGASRRPSAGSRAVAKQSARWAKVSTSVPSRSRMSARNGPEKRSMGGHCSTGPATQRALPGARRYNARVTRGS